MSLILQFYFVLGLPMLNLCWREQIRCVQSCDHVFNATLLMVDGNLKFKPNDKWHLLSFWYRVQILLLKYKVNMKFLTRRSKEKVLFLFLYILVSLHPGTDPFILEGVWPFLVTRCSVQKSSCLGFMRDNDDGNCLWAYTEFQNLWSVFLKMLFS